MWVQGDGDLGNRKEDEEPLAAPPPQPLGPPSPASLCGAGAVSQPPPPHRPPQGAPAGFLGIWPWLSSGPSLWGRGAPSDHSFKGSSHWLFTFSPVDSNKPPPRAGPIPGPLWPPQSLRVGYPAQLFHPHLASLPNPVPASWLSSLQMAPPAKAQKKSGGSAVKGLLPGPPRQGWVFPVGAMLILCLV